MKRPLMWICLLCTALLITVYFVGNFDKSSPLSNKEEQALYATATGPVMIQGTVCKCAADQTGYTILINHIYLFKNNSESNSENKSETKSKNQIETNWGTYKFRSGIKLQLKVKTEIYQPGDVLAITGSIKEFSCATNPGEFDQKGYYYAQNVAASIKSDEIVLLKRDNFALSAILWKIRTSLRHIYERIMPSSDAALVAAITLGEKGVVDGGWKDLFQEGGIAHILAVSGLHISLCGMAIYRMLRKMRRSILTSAISALLVTFCFALMTGMGISAVRAFLMFSIWLGAQICGRKTDMPTSAAVAGILICIQNPRTLSQASFWLSFSAIWSIAVILPILDKSVKWKHTAALLPGLSICIGTMPVSAYFFYQLTPWSILINLLVIPLMPFVMCYGLLSALFGSIHQSLGIFVGGGIHVLLLLFEKLCLLSQNLPYSILVVGRPKIWQMMGYYLFLLLNLQYMSKKKTSFFFKTKKLPSIFSIHKGRIYTIFQQIRPILIWSICILFLSVKIDRPTRVICMDVGQGDCSLVQMKGQSFLIDAGSSGEEKVWEYKVEKSLKYVGIRKLDAIFLTHADEDHINAVQDFLEDYERNLLGQNIHGVTIGSIILPIRADTEGFSKIIQLAKKNKIPLRTMQAKDEIECQTSTGKIEWKIECLWPQEKYLRGVENEDSLVLKVSTDRFSMLFMGDLENQGEYDLIGSDADLQADILKVGHHGSRNATSMELLQEVRPQLGIISCGLRNRYGHPHEEVLENLTTIGCGVRRTDEEGAIGIK